MLKPCSTLTKKRGVKRSKRKGQSFGSDGIREKNLKTRGEEEGICLVKQTRSYHRCPCYCNKEWPIIEHNNGVSPFERSPEENDILNIRPLLFTDERDYLLKNNGEKVKFGDLAGKVIVLYILALSGHEREPFITRDLIEAYDQLWHKGIFEVVFVAIDREKDEEEEQLFHDLFSKMPWAAIPYSDDESRFHLECTFCLFPVKDCRVDHPSCKILDPSGKVLSTRGHKIFDEYGAEGFPFTSERIDFLKWEQSYLLNDADITNYLTSPDRDFVISLPQGDKVPVQILNDKVVGLFFFKEGFNPDLMEKMKSYYLELKQAHNFEIVIVYMHFTFEHPTEKSFQESFSGMPWLALPFKDSRCRRMRRLFHYPDKMYRSYKFVLSVIGPRGEYVQYDSLSILKRYGIKAYPFTRKDGVDMEIRRIKEAVKLEMILSTDCHMLRKDGSKVVVSELMKKKVLILFATNSCCERGRFLSLLCGLYHLKKGSDEEFEVIYISLDCVKSAFDEGDLKLPWLVHPFDKKLATKWMRRLFRDPNTGIPAIAAFKEGGDLVGRESNLLIKKSVSCCYTYIKDLGQEVSDELNNTLFTGLSHQVNSYI